MHTRQQHRNRWYVVMKSCDACCLGVVQAVAAKPVDAPVVSAVVAAPSTPAVEPAEVELPASEGEASKTSTRRRRRAD